MAAQDGRPSSPAELAADGAALLRQGRAAAARGLLEQAVAGLPADPFAWSNLASARQHLGDPAGALAAMRHAVALAPAHPDLQYNLGSLLSALGETGAAEQALRRTIALSPRHARAWNSLGLVLSRTPPGGGPERPAQAAAAFRRALLHGGGDGEAWHNLARLHHQEGRLHAALACLRQAAAVQPRSVAVQFALADVCRDLGRAPDAQAALQAVLAIAPGSGAARAALIFALDFDPRSDTAAQQQARRAWAAGFAAAIPTAPALLPAAGAERAQPDPGRVLHVGYVSAEFNTHSAAATFAAPILHHDPRAVRVTCYYTVRWDDPFNRRFRAAAEGWRQADGVPDAALAEQVRADGIDILVDLAGHTPGHRLGVFARRPAPLQATGWGHCTGTGLPRIDALMADPVLIPPAERPLFAERVVDLPCALSYTPFEAAPPALPEGGLPPRPGPPHEQAWPTFGALGRSAKLGPDCIALWARAMHAVSGSRLYLKDPAFGDRLRRREVELGFAARGIDPSRLAFAGRTDWARHMRAYWHVDIALDTSPAGGGVTTLEALWMGVPVVSLYGRFPSSRIGASILTACGAGEWVARSPAEFAAIAQRLAAGLDRLRQGRAALRTRLRRCPPYDPDAYARAVEAAYRSLWHDWCAGQAVQEGGAQPGR